MTPHRLARLLRPFGIASKQLRIGEHSLKGYERTAFVDAWERYLDGPLSPPETKHRNTEHAAGFDVSLADPSVSVADGGAVVPVEDDYPASAWDIDPDEDEPEPPAQIGQSARESTEWLR